MRGKTIIFLSFFIILLSLSFISANLAEGLVSYWKLDGVSGPVVDSYGSNDGINYNATRGIIGKINYALDFNGADDYIDCGNDSSLNFEGGDFTLMAWVKTSDTTNYQEVISKSDVAENDYYELWVQNGKFYFGLMDGGSGMTCGSLTIYADGDWHLLVGIRRGTNLEIYVDGNFTKSVALGGVDVISTTEILTIGNWWTGGWTFNGSIDEIGIWNRSLTDSEILELYNNGTGKSYPFYFENATFENVNIINNLDVGQDVSALKGFFDYLGSSISRIVKGWFNEIDTINIITQNIKVNNTNVCLEDGINCPSVDVPDIKSGSEFVIEDSCTSISFNTAFSSTPTPIVTGNIESAGDNNVVSIGSLSITGFDLCLNKVGAGGGNYTVYWIATNAGNS